MGHVQEREANHPTYPAGTLTAQLRFNSLRAAGKPFCHYVPVAPDAEGYYRTVMVVEGEPGYFCLGVHSKDLRKAECEASDKNHRLGLTEDDATRIVSTSIRAQIMRDKKA